MQRYNQNDPAWKNVRFGVQGSPCTIGLYGCTITSIGNHIDKTPLEIKDKLSYVPDANLIWASISNLPNCTFTWRQWDGNYSVIVDRFNRGEKSLVNIALGGGLLHWLAIIGINGDNLICIDPNNPVNNTNIHKSRVIGSAFFTCQPTTPQPPVINNQTHCTVLKGWGLSNVAEASGLLINEQTYQEIYNLNQGFRGSWNWQSLNARMGAGDVLRVRPDPVIVQDIKPVQPQPEALTPANPTMPTITTDTHSKELIEAKEKETKLLKEIEKLEKDLAEIRSKEFEKVKQEIEIDNTKVSNWVKPLVDKLFSNILSQRLWATLGLSTLALNQVKDAFLQSAIVLIATGFFLISRTVEKFKK